MPDPHESIRQDVQQEAAEEFFGAEREQLLLAVPIILPSESDLSVFEFEEPVIADCHAMGVATEIAQDLGRSAERPFGIDDPFFAPQLSKQRTEARRLPHLRQLTVKRELRLLESLRQGRQEQPAKEA